MTFVRMDGDEDFMFRPILEHLIPYSALDDPAYDLANFVELNEAMDVAAENQARIRKAREVAK